MHTFEVGISYVCMYVSLFQNIELHVMNEEKMQQQLYKYIHIYIYIHTYTPLEVNIYRK